MLGYITYLSRREYNCQRNNCLMLGPSKLLVINLEAMSHSRIPFSVSVEMCGTEKKKGYSGFASTCPLMISMITLYKHLKSTQYTKSITLNMNCRHRNWLVLFWSCRSNLSLQCQRFRQQILGQVVVFFYLNSFYPWQCSFSHLSENNSFLLNLQQRLKLRVKIIVLWQFSFVTWNEPKVN